MDGCVDESKQERGFYTTGQPSAASAAIRTKIEEWLNTFEYENSHLTVHQARVKLLGMLNGACWRDELPDEQGYWWWWDCDGLPVPVSIMFSGTDNTYFATAGQLGWNRAQNVKDMGGMWMRLHEPETP